MPPDPHGPPRLSAASALRPEGPPSAGGYLPIAEHGLIGDLRTAALVGSEGTIDWYCPQRFDAPSVFGALLDARRGGHWSLCPSGRRWSSRRRYLPGTNVLSTRFVSDDGELELEDFMPPDGAPGTLVRRVVGLRGDPHLVMEVEPRFDYGRSSHAVGIHERGARFEGPGLSLALDSPVALRPTRRGVQAKLSAAPGQVHAFVLRPSPTRAPEQEPTGDAARGSLDATIGFWREWLAGSAYRGRWRDNVERSALALKLLLHSPSGALLSAATTSLPERLEGWRSRDLRHAVTGHAELAAKLLLSLGFERDAQAIRTWLAGCAPDYVCTIDGDCACGGGELPALEGYRGCGPARIGGSAQELMRDPSGFPCASFRTAERLARAGRPGEARVAFERTLACANSLGLLSEEIGAMGEQLGNLPDAASHLALISTALALDQTSAKT